METKSKKPTPENFVKDVRRKARRLFTSEQKILIVMEAIRGETSVAEICRKYGIHQPSFTSGINSFWKPVKSGLPATPPVKPHQMK